MPAKAEAKQVVELADRNDYLSAGVHIGMRFKTKQMDRFIFKTRPDGLSVLDVEKIDERIKVAGKFLSGYKKIMIISRKINGFKPVKKFSELVEGKAMVGRFLPGVLTNPHFKEYYEPDIIIITDPVADKQVAREAVKKRIPIIALCDTYNELSCIDFIIPANNKGKKSLGLVYFLLAREILKNRKKIKSDKEFPATLDDFTEKD